MSSWSMSRRLITTLLVLISAIWLIGVGIAAIAIRHEIDEVFDASLQETAQRLLPLALYDIEETAEGEQEEMERLADLFLAEGRKEAFLHYQIRNAEGQVMLRSHGASVEPFPAPLKAGYFDDRTQRYFTEASLDNSAFVQVVEVPEEREEAVQAIWLGLSAPLFALLPIAAFVVYWTVKGATRPIIEVQRQIGMRSGENLEPIDTHGLPQELTPITHDMNRLLERLKAALEAERSFAANAAHELRNPVAAARAQAEVIAESSRGSPNQDRAIQLIEMLARLSNRLEKMLQLARAEAGLGFARTETNLVDITRLVVADCARKPQLAARVAFDPGPNQALIVAIDPDALGIALQNLIDNALSHGTAGSAIDVAIGPGATVKVTNEGPVVSADELATLKKPFERGGARAPGAGLGLSIVEQVMRQAGGHLELASPAPGRKGGFEAALVFPAVEHAHSDARRAAPQSS